ncbi:MAG: DUF192 domain-containing protein [Patescibacteria group bacterium]
MRWSIFIVLSLILGVFFWMWGGSEISKEIPFYYQKIMGKTISLEINGAKINAEIAKSQAEKIKGLSNRDELASDRGMIFVYDQEEIPSFWLKETRFPLDIIWIKDDVIVDLTENAPIDAGPNFKTYSPKTAVTRVLEVNAGFCQKQGIAVGQKVLYSKKIK